MATVAVIAMFSIEWRFTIAVLVMLVLPLIDTIRIVVSHKFDETLLRKYDAVTMMQDGRIIESGKYNELVDSQGYLYALKQVGIKL